ncbi:MAG: PilZ domain-containing protein [Alphaproteobacteria bacterium]|nr:PilZ domain-containing protein [Alphaproteobacteria bacterium]
MNVASARPTDVEDACFEGHLPGRYSLERAARQDGSPRVFSCRTHRISPDKLIVEAPVCGEVGERVKAWIEHFELVAGRVCTVGDRSFGISLQLTPKAREVFANRILWVRNHVEEKVPDLRSGRRMPMPNMKPVIILANGHVENCFIIDASVTGAAISAEIELKPGTRLALGCVVGTVVRQLETGFAMQFDDEQDPDCLRQWMSWLPPHKRA